MPGVSIKHTVLRESRLHLVETLFEVLDSRGLEIAAVVQRQPYERSMELPARPAGAVVVCSLPAQMFGPLDLEETVKTRDVA